MRIRSEIMAGGSVVGSVECFIIFIVLMVFFLFLILTAVVRIYPYEEGLVIVLGFFKRKIKQGLHFVPPVITNVVKIDLRTQRFSTVITNVRTKDNKIYDLDISGAFKVVDSEKAYFEITDYREGTLSLLHANVQAVAGDMTRKELAWKKRELESGLKKNLNKQVSLWGLRIENISLDNIEMLAGEKDGLKYANKIELAVRLRERISKETGKFGVIIEQVEFGKELNG